MSNRNPQRKMSRFKLKRFMIEQKEFKNKRKELNKYFFVISFAFVNLHNILQNT